MTSIVCGLVTRDYIIQAVERLSRDEFATKRLTGAQISEVKNNPKLLDLSAKRNDFTLQIHSLGYNKIPETKEKTDLYDKYITVKARFNTKKAVLKDKRLKAEHDKYFATVDTKEISNQLSGIMPRKAYILPVVEYELPDRAMAAQLFFEPLDNLEASDIF